MTALFYWDYKPKVRQNFLGINEAIQHFSKAINMERDERNLIAVEKGILQAQINFLMDEIATLETAQKNDLKTAEESIE